MTTHPTYNHWRLALHGVVAKLEMDVQESETISSGYELKLNSYDLGVDLDLHDAIEHPKVLEAAVVGRADEPHCARPKSFNGVPDCTFQTRRHDRGIGRD